MTKDIRPYFTAREVREARLKFLMRRSVGLMMCPVLLM